VKRSIIIASVAVAIAAAGGTTAALLLPWSSIVAKLLFFASSPEIKTEGQVSEHPLSVHDKPAESVTAEQVAENLPTNPDSRLGSEAIEHEANAKKDEVKSIELIPAADFVLPSTRSSLITKAMREITALQSDLAYGRSDAPQKLKSAMLKMPALLAESDLKKINASEVQAIALYVLSGGEPSLTLKLLKSAVLTEQQRDLLLGTFSYATGDTEKAAEKLLPLVPKEFDTVLTAQLKMAQAQLAPKDSRTNTIRQLSLVADTVPGTLIEEAAIRRIVSRIDYRNDLRGFFYWTGRYLRRFPESLYYQDFESSFVTAAVDMPTEKMIAVEKGLTATFRLAGAVRTEMFARRILLSAIAKGNMEICSQTAKAILPVFDLEAPDFKNVSALLKACVAAEGNEGNLKALKAIQVADLDAIVARHVTHALTMGDAIQIQSPLHDDGTFGPHEPLSQDEGYGDLFASVAQQLDVSTGITNKVDDDEIGTNK
jgi:chemotaxis protein MotC